VALKRAGLTISALVEIGDAIASLPNHPAGLDTIGEDLLGLAAVQYLDRRHAVLVPLLRLVTLLGQRRFTAVIAPDGETLQREPVRVDRFDIGRIRDLLGNPVGTLKAEYHLASGLTQPDLTADTLFPRIAAVAQALGLPVFFGFDPTDGIDLGTFGNDRAPHMLMLFIPISADVMSESAGLGVGLALDQTLGLVVHPFGTLNVSETVGRWGLQLTTTAGLPPFAVSSSGVRFASGSSFTDVKFKLSASLLPGAGASPNGDLPVFQIGSTDGTRLELSEFRFVFDGNFTPSGRDFGVQAQIGKAALVIASSDGDGFLGAVLPAGSRIEFQLGIGWSTQRGLYFQGSAGLDVTLPLSFSIGDVLDVDAVQLRILVSQEIDLIASATVSLHLGPVTATAEGLGLKTALTFPTGGGNLGPLDGSLGFLLPRGIGIDVDAGPVSGGGFLFLDPDAGRYAGAVELSVFSISVKAFGVIDTKFPDGHKGFSFVIVISAEFTPIQLGFGFTLLGVGGLIGINRTLDADGLRNAIRSRGLDHVLFPHDPVGDAPAIISDLSAIFPPSEGRYVFGPMAKLGWGTPTIIDAELGIVLVLPGPQLAVLGEVHSVLPTENFPLVELNFAVAGVLDVPQKRFSLDASLHDSHVGDFPMSGDMAMRLAWGDNPNFALAVGGFNPAYKPPPGFPSLSRVTVDLGVDGNPSLTLQGYLAITSNTAQVGARAELNARGGGLRLHGFIGFDALFVFSPFSFRASFDAGVDVTFHGHGIGLHVHGAVSGPSPWHIEGSVCVSILFWDACLDFSKDFGGSTHVELPSLDPFLGSPSGAAIAAQQIIGLKNALEDPRSWSSAAPAGAFSAVTLALGASEAPTPVDPMGAASLHQRVVPLNRPITLFAGARPLGPGRYDVQRVTLSGGIVATASPVQDSFAPAAFQKMSDAQKLSSPSFEKMDAGVLVSSDAVTVGTIVPEPITYKTIVIDPRTTTPPTAPDVALTARHLAGMTARSSTALAGLRVSGIERFVDPTAAVQVTLADQTYVVAQRTTLAAASGFVSSLSKTALALGVEAAVAATPALAGQLQIIPAHELRQ